MHFACLAFAIRPVGAILLVTAAALAASPRGKAPPPAVPPPPAMSVTSYAFKDGAAIPERHTVKGGDRSPPIKVSHPPKGARTLALICADLDASDGREVHWLAWNIPAQPGELREALWPNAQLQDGTRQGMNDFRKIGYAGPVPPPGRMHTYRFRVYALDAALDLRPGANVSQLLDAMAGHVLGEADLTGTCQR